MIIKTNPHSELENGSGFHPLSGIQVVSVSGNFMHLSGISVNNRLLGGGFHLVAEDMDKLAQAWIDRRKHEVEYDFSDIQHYGHVKRALEVAIAGNHKIVVFCNNTNLETCYRFSQAFLTTKRKTDPGCKAEMITQVVCPCGNYNTIKQPCTCDPETIVKYWKLNFRQTPTPQMYIDMGDGAYLASEKSRVNEPDNAIVERIRYAKNLLHSTFEVSNEAKLLAQTALKYYTEEKMIEENWHSVSKTIAALSERNYVTVTDMAEAIQYSIGNTYKWIRDSVYASLLSPGS